MKHLLKNRLQAFVPAISGLSQAIKNEAALKVHIAASAVVLIIVASGYYPFHKNVLLMLACFGVIIVELLNTSIEKLCDLYTTKTLPSIKFIKDVGAGAVLLSAVGALLVASYVLFG